MTRMDQTDLRKRKRNHKQIWTDEQDRYEIESRGLVYPNLVALGGYGGKMMFSIDGNDSGEVLPAVKWRGQRQRRRSSPASTGANLGARGRRRREGNEICRGVDRYL